MHVCMQGRGVQLSRFPPQRGAWRQKAIHLRSDASRDVRSSCKLPFCTADEEAQLAPVSDAAFLRNLVHLVGSDADAPSQA